MKIDMQFLIMAELKTLRIDACVSVVLIKP